MKFCLVMILKNSDYNYTAIFLVVFLFWYNIIVVVFGFNSFNLEELYDKWLSHTVLDWN
jgi:hypothetical protein